MDENKKKGQFMGSVVFIFHTSANIAIGVKSAPIWPHFFMVKELQHDISPKKCMCYIQILLPMCSFLFEMFCNSHQHFFLLHMSSIVCLCDSKTWQQYWRKRSVLVWLMVRRIWYRSQSSAQLPPLSSKASSWCWTSSTETTAGQSQTYDGWLDQNPESCQFLG